MPVDLPEPLPERPDISREQIESEIAAAKLHNEQIDSWWWGGTQAFSGNLWGTFKLWDNSEVADNFENLRAEGRGILSSGYFAFGASFGENIGVGTLTSAYEGRNAAGEKLSPGGRALYAVGGLGELALNVVGLKGAVVSARAAPQAARVALRNGTRAYQGAKAALQTGWKQLIDWRTARRAVDGKLDEALEQLGKTADNTLKEVADDFAKPVTVEGIANLAEANITNSGKTVLGHFPGYINKAKARGASYFDIGDAWDSLTDAQRWAANKHFLDKIADAGDQVLLSLPKGQIREGSFLVKEIEYLINKKGYRWINQWALGK